MPWGFAIGAAATIYSADKSNKSSEKAINAAEGQAATDAQMQSDMLAYYKERDAESAALQAEANAIAGRVADSQIATMDQQRDQSGQYFDRLKSTFWPLENSLVTDATNYDTPERRQAAASNAMADVEAQIQAQKGIQQRSMTRMGVNPNSGAFGSAMNSMSLGAASAKAAAGNQAVNSIEDKGWARKYDASALGRNLPSNSATSAGNAVAAGNSAASSAYAPVNAFNSATQLMGSGMMNASSIGASSAGNLASMYGNQANAWQSAAAGLGSMTGQAAGVYYANQNNQAANLAYANGVSAGGGDGMGAFISKNGW